MTLLRRMQQVQENVYARLKDSELPENSFNLGVHRILRLYGVNKGDYEDPEARSCSAVITEKLRRILGIVSVRGYSDNYVVLEGKTPLSDFAKQDILKYEKTRKKVEGFFEAGYLQFAIGREEEGEYHRRIYEKDFNSAIRNHVNFHAQGMNLSARKNLIRELQDKYKALWQDYITSGTGYSSEEYDLESISAALSKIALKKVNP